MSSKKGNYYKLKTKKWLIEKGYCADYIERYQTIAKKEGGILRIKRDLFGSDILAFNKEEIIFVQVKLGRKNVAEGIKGFAGYPFPPFVQRWVVVWEVGVGEPEIVQVEEGAELVNMRAEEEKGKIEIKT